MNQSASTQKPNAHYWDRPNPSTIWRPFLARARADGPGLKRWQLWAWWSRPRSTRERLRAILTLAVAPITTAAAAYHLIQASGGEVQHTHGVTRVAQYWTMIVHWIRYGLAPTTYYKYQLYLPERGTHAKDYVEEATRLLQLIARRIPLTEDDETFIDKRAFELWCRKNDLPTVATIADFEDGKINRHIVGSLPARSLFSKPTNLRAGMGACLWEYKLIDGVSHWSAEPDADLLADELEAHLASLSRTEARPFVLQPCLTNHSTIKNLSKGRLSTVRFMTTRAEPNHPAKPLLAVLRIPVGDSIADNFDAGGIAAPIDLVQGTCGRGVRKKAKYPLQPVAVHPDTGAELEGLKLPFWNETLALALRAHNALSSQMPVIGWDIAILPEGPILIESNHFPCGNLAQVPTGFPLGETEYAHHVVSLLRKQFL